MPLTDTSYFAATAESIWENCHQDYPPLSVEILTTIDSSNSELIRRSKSQPIETNQGVTLLLALNQTAGHGRFGRQWQSQDVTIDTNKTTSTQAPPCLTFSLGLTWPYSHLNGLSLSMGLALAQTLHESVQLKWPNDLILNGRKLGGILIETSGQLSERYLVCGIGINIDSFQTLDSQITKAHLKEVLPNADVRTVFHRCAIAALLELKRFSQAGFSHMEAAWNKKNAYYQQSIKTSNGIEGVNLGVTKTGSLRLRTSLGEQEITSGEIMSNTPPITNTPSHL